MTSAGSYSVRVTDGNSCSATSSVTVVTENAIVTPMFTQVGNSCPGATLSALPTTSNNTITGTWSPALNNAATTTYTFTPTAGQCASTATMTITVSDTQAPSITCPNDVTINTTAGLCTSNSSIGTASATDNCNITLGNALHFDGTDYASVIVPGSFLGTTPTTIEFWVKNSSTFTFPMDLGFTWQVQFSNGNFQLSGFFLGAYSTGATVSTSGTVWEHFALTYDGAGTWKAYKNGQPTSNPSCTMASCFGTPSYAGTTKTNPELRIGVGNNSYFYTGALDEVRIWNVERTQSQIAANLYNELSGTETGLKQYFNFNQGVAGGNNTSISNLTATTGGTGTLYGLNLNGSTSNIIAGQTLSASVK